MATVLHFTVIERIVEAKFKSLNQTNKQSNAKHSANIKTLMSGGILSYQGALSKCTFAFNNNRDRTKRALVRPVVQTWRNQSSSLSS